jgi:hypothetical protein
VKGEWARIATILDIRNQAGVWAKITKEQELLLKRKEIL